MIDLDVAELLGWQKRIAALAVDVTGTRLIVAGGGGAWLYDADSGERVAELAHSDGICAAAFSPDGARLVTGSADMGVRLWRSDDGALRFLAKGHLHDVVAVGWTPDGAGLATASSDGSVRLWRVDGDDLIEDRVLRVRLPLALAWSADGRTLAVATETAVLVIGRDGEHRAEQPWPGACAVTAAAGGWLIGTAERAALCGADLAVRVNLDGASAAVLDAGRLLTAAGARVRVVDLDGREVAGFEAHAAGVLAVAALPGAVASAGRDGLVRVWTRGGELVGEVGHGHEVNLLAVAAGGHRVASCARNGQVRVWSPAEAAPPRRDRAAVPAPVWADDLGGHAGLALSPDGARLAVCHGGRLEIRAVADGARLLGVDGCEPGSLQWSSRALVVMAGPDRRCQVYDPLDLRLVATLEPDQGELELIDDRLLIRHRVVMAAAVHLHALVDGEPPRELAVIRGEQFIDTVAPSPDRSRVVIGFRGDGARLVNLRTGGLIGAVGWAGWGGAVFSPDGTRLLTCGVRGTALWDPASGARVRELAIARGWHAAWSPRGDRIAVATSNGPLLLVDADGAEVARMGGGGVFDGLSNPLFSAEGDLLSAWHRRQPVRVWRADTGAVVAELGGHASDHLAIRFVGANRLLTWANVTPSTDLVLRLWDRSGHPVAILAGQAGQSFWKVEVAPDQRRVVSLVNGDTAAWVWRSADGEPFGPLGGHRGLLRWGLFAPGGDAGLLLTASDGGTLRTWSLPR